MPTLIRPPAPQPGSVADSGTTEGSTASDSLDSRPWARKEPGVNADATKAPPAPTTIHTSPTGAPLTPKMSRPVAGENPVTTDKKALSPMPEERPQKSLLSFFGGQSKGKSNASSIFKQTNKLATITKKTDKQKKVNKPEVKSKAKSPAKSPTKSPAKSPTKSPAKSPTDQPKEGESQPSPSDLPMASPPAMGSTPKQGKPVGAKTPFMFYTDAMKTQIKVEHPDLKSNAIRAKAGEMWKAESKEVREKYDAMGKEDRERYKREMAAWTGSGAVAASPASQHAGGEGDKKEHSGEGSSQHSSAAGPSATTVTHRAPTSKVALDGTKIASYESKLRSYLSDLQSRPVPVLAPPAEPVAFVEANAEVQIFTAVSHLIEGSSLPLTQLVTKVEQGLCKFLSGVPPEMSESECLKAKIQLAAERKNYGMRPRKGVVVDEDCEKDAIWTWELRDIAVLAKDAANKFVKPERAFRRRVSARVKACARVVDVLKRRPGDNAKISEEEERVMKFEREDEAARIKEAMKKKEREAKEAEKAKEAAMKEEAAAKRKELIDKAKAQKKAEAELLKLQNNALRVERAAMAAEEKLTRAYLKEASKTDAERARDAEQERIRLERLEAKNKKAKTLEKQKNLMSSFFKKRKEPPAAVAKEEERKVDGPSPSASAAWDSDAFWSSVNSGKAPPSTKEIKRVRGKGKFEKVKVFVTVFPTGANAFSQNAPFSELREVNLWNRTKHLQFFEDERPPYKGTWSKRSTEVTGRRPFGKDKRLDYDYDSEAEWEEEEPGEDLDSIGGDADEEEPKGEAEYDYGDGWMRDDESLGSDDDDDGAKALRKRSKLNEGSLLNEKIIIGCDRGGVPVNLSSQQGEAADLLARSGVVVLQRDVDVCRDAYDAKSSAKKAGAALKEAKVVTAEVLPLLMDFVNNNTTSSKEKLVEDFLKVDFAAKGLQAPSKKQVMSKITEIATKVSLDVGGVVWRVKGSSPAPVPPTDGALDVFLTKSPVDPLSTLKSTSALQEPKEKPKEKETEEQRRKRMYGEIDFMSIVNSKKAKTS